jgi:hypothetical protein
MKFKKLYTSFICYLTVIAFVSIICREVSEHSDFFHEKTEINSCKTNIITNMDLVFDEENDADDLINYTFLTHINLISGSLNSLAFNKFHKNIANKNNKLVKTSNLKNPLFLSFRALRI